MPNISKQFLPLNIPLLIRQVTRPTPNSCEYQDHDFCNHKITGKKNFYEKGIHLAKLYSVCRKCGMGRLQVWETSYWFESGARYSDILYPEILDTTEARSSVRTFIVSKI